MKPGDADPLRESLQPYYNQGHRDGPIVIDDWAGGIPQTRAQLPSVRIGRRWFSSLWLLPLGVIGLVLSIAVVREMAHYEWFHEFIARYPGTSTQYVEPVDSGFPWWLRWQHFFNLLFMMFIIRAGLQILADHPRLYLNAGSKPDTEWMRLREPVPVNRRDSDDAETIWTAKEDSVALPKQLGLPGFRHSVGLARWWHFSFDLLWLINGVLFIVLLFCTDQWKRLVPTSLDVFPNALSTALQYLSLQLPENAGFSTYNALQLLAYFITIFIAAPLAFVTGLLQAPSIAGRFGTGAGLLNRQVARTVHFGVLVWMLIFIVMHTVMIFITGFVGNVNHITLGTNTNSWWGVALYGAWMAIVIVFWLVASPLTIRYPRAIQNAGKLVVGRLKALLEQTNPTATYSEDDISPYFWTNGEKPESDEYRQLEAGRWENYRLRVDGLVQNPLELSYAQLLALPRQDQITQHFCIQGWSGIAKWSGVPMSVICEMAKPHPSARWVVFYSFADGPEGGRYYDCHPIANMHHHQTILAYEMNGEPLNVSHGAPLRLRDEVELGFKQVKWIVAIEFVESFEHLGAGQGGYNEDQEFYGYRMPI
ncbi:DMSO/TMAO reductase YedYZ molybdopterin-dependent catalytic subunit/thiosulfate reductase cytochrome b subunit [Mycolicibacterium sp. BK556]|uniref:molybdopterin-dependent oxidoreductase n=1 Tax=unclassified Mycolicibacterium TaxID=2636767 RepID=UPI001614DDB2|nr:MULTISPECIES: molybdopterin-dependent oxidoreductase [unclassified Mycolicibacterium]MBB3601724.1 DMSO/TMAO reductase YedYZ molybdopterin-dependent catalytic subunit/thiosulfate reductase cytochrome b subunit [Mycolicibacterium sp. BK556]MBB3631476.1 DMSO/TMAO reductase YedYZ molybdopterin-dependent catalytic subunit/thiosulfate reductase cytochrome b subunit [Mycolicibacterium sp. BK607]